MSVKKKSTRSAAAKARPKTKSVKVNKNAWFVATRWSYIPVTPQGWSLYVPYTSLLILVLLVAGFQETIAEGIVVAIPGLFAITAAFQWFAAHKS